ncbi:hypothetical protein [Lewinella sp. 4G2]|uniref:hypothetical protein n=1 Tax=Lewinella sp. 4G2 TaxID=1803372 RepID=UPI0007B4AC4F|nr:hypothetical protein [Lewinella sp. 4G2]OAV44569.1 hypothetical protein A3850_008730 [Lewinella sp. 4G2]
MRNSFYLLLLLFAFASCEDDNGLLVVEEPVPNEPVVVEVEPVFNLKSVSTDAIRISKGTAWERTPGDYVISSDRINCVPDGVTSITVTSDTFLYINFTLDEAGLPVLKEQYGIVAGFAQENDTDITAFAYEGTAAACQTSETTFTANFDTPGFISGELSVQLYDARAVAIIGGSNPECSDYAQADLSVFTATFNVPIEDPCE